MNPDLVQDIIVLIIGISVVILNIITLTQMRDKYVKQTEFKEELNNYIPCTVAMKEWTRKEDCLLLRDRCCLDMTKEITRIGKELDDLREINMRKELELKTIRKLLGTGDEKFTYISLLLRELCSKADISDKTIDELKKIAFNHRDVT